MSKPSDPKLSGRERLRAYEELRFQYERPGGRSERGSGSAYSKLLPIERDRFHAFDQLIKAEDHLSAVQAKANAVLKKLAAAEKALETAERWVSSYGNI